MWCQPAAAKRVTILCPRQPSRWPSPTGVCAPWMSETAFCIWKPRAMSKPMLPVASQSQTCAVARQRFTTSKAFRTVRPVHHEPFGSRGASLGTAHRQRLDRHQTSGLLFLSRRCSGDRALGPGLVTAFCAMINMVAKGLTPFDCGKGCIGVGMLLSGPTIMVHSGRNGPPCRNRTCNRPLRRRVLYPVELRADKRVSSMAT